ncbi:hypothetical protein [Sphingopyxis flava]|uniref:PRC-barrel domain-containing protein n=1 Tax=Sphingopyxis flava TaxID=1507287 RepID=A0A1T5CHA3_9SPHN|nr:hypothetical protein [Sphingopyxis flava]SKB58814.1 hypothetical protein SAMN06295937_101073 [Sphingopyxis flava]
MRKTLILLAASAAAVAAPALAQLDTGVAGQVGGSVDPGRVAGGVVQDVTQPVGGVVDQVDQTANDAIGSTDLKLAAREDVRAGANVTDSKGNSIGTVQSIDGDNAVVVSDGKLYNIPLSALYSHAAGTAHGLVTKLPKAELEARGAAAAETDAANPGR